MAVPEVAENLGARLLFTLGTCGSMPIHSEMYMKRFIAVNNLDVVMMTKFRFFRMRATGRLQLRDVEVNQPCDPVQFRVQLARMEAIRLSRLPAEPA